MALMDRDRDREMFKIRVFCNLWMPECGVYYKSDGPRRYDLLILIISYMFGCKLCVWHFLSKCAEHSPQGTV